MGQKINPIGLRLGVNRTWDSRWFAGGADYARLLHQDLKLREWLRERLAAAGVSRIIIERPHKKCRITIYAARPGVVIGKKGADIEKLRKDISAQTEGEVHLNIVEVRKPETDAQLIAENIAQQLERRVAFLRDYLRSTPARGFVLGISGGQDSTLAGRLAQLAVERVRAEGGEATFIAMRLPYGVQADEADAHVIGTPGKARRRFTGELVLDHQLAGQGEHQGDDRNRDRAADAVHVGLIAVQLVRVAVEDHVHVRGGLLDHGAELGAAGHLVRHLA